MFVVQFSVIRRSPLFLPGRSWLRPLKLDVLVTLRKLDPLVSPRGCASSKLSNDRTRSLTEGELLYAPPELMRGAGLNAWAAGIGIGWVATVEVFSRKSAASACECWDV
jgi:hypothetical protein